MINNSKELVVDQSGYNATITLQGVSKLTRTLDALTFNRMGHFPDTSP